jgi:hypothetical protein
LKEPNNNEENLMKKLLILPFLFFVSCATPLTKKEASFVYIEKTGLSAESAYNMTLAYLAKSLGNSNKAIQLKDPKKHKFISQIAIECNDVKNGMLDIASYTTSFTIEADFKDKRARISLSGDSYNSTNIDGSYIAVKAPFKSHQKEGLKLCADKLKAQVIESLKVSNNSNW